MYTSEFDQRKFLTTDISIWASSSWNLRRSANLRRIGIFLFSIEFAQRRDFQLQKAQNSRHSANSRWSNSLVYTGLKTVFRTEKVYFFSTPKEIFLKLVFLSQSCNLGHFQSWYSCHSLATRVWNDYKFEFFSTFLPVVSHYKSGTGIRSSNTSSCWKKQLEALPTNVTYFASRFTMSRR